LRVGHHQRCNVVGVSKEVRVRAFELPFHVNKPIDVLLNLPRLVSSRGSD
jgi:hypothetical protein